MGKVKSKGKSKEVARPYPFTADRSVCTFVHAEKRAGRDNAVYIRAIYKDVSISEAMAIFPHRFSGATADNPSGMVKNDENGIWEPLGPVASFTFGRNIFRQRTISEVCNVAGCDEKEAREILALEPYSVVWGKRWLPFNFHDKVRGVYLPSFHEEINRYPTLDAVPWIKTDNRGNVVKRFDSQEDRALIVVNGKDVYERNADGERVEDEYNLEKEFHWIERGWRAVNLTDYLTVGIEPLSMPEAAPVKIAA